MANVFLVSQILMLFHPPEGSQNKLTECEKHGICWSNLFGTLQQLMHST